jgi:hypothetical protein
VPQETILRVLHEALADSRSDLDVLIERLIGVYRGKESLERTEQVIALGFLVCARALRESSLMEEIAVREELHELHRLAGDILEAVHRTERAVELEREALRRRRGPRELVEDLRPADKRD